MVNIYILKQQLTPEQNKVLDEVLFERDNTIIAYKILSRQYAETKRKIRAIEKRLIPLYEQQPEKNITLTHIGGQVSAIENKYPVIDKAIKNYKWEIKQFNWFLNRPEFRTFYPDRPGDWHIHGMRHHLSTANMYIERGLDAIRITKRYFKNITESFQSYTLTQKFYRSQEIRKAEAEAKLAAEQAAEQAKLLANSDASVNEAHEGATSPLGFAQDDSPELSH